MRAPKPPLAHDWKCTAPEQQEWLEILRKFHVHCAPWTRCESSEILDCYNCSLSNIARALAAAPVAVPAGPRQCEHGALPHNFSEYVHVPSPLPPPQEPTTCSRTCPVCTNIEGAAEHVPETEAETDYYERHAALAGETRTAGVGFGEEAWLGLVAKTDESLTPEQRQNITAVLEAVDTALNKDRDGVKALATRLLKQQQKLTTAEAALTQARAQKSTLMEAIEPFVLPAKTIKSLDVISRDDGKPRMCAKIFDNKITDKQLERAARVYEQVKKEEKK